MLGMGPAAGILQSDNLGFLRIPLAAGEVGGSDKITFTVRNARHVM